jgi:hypothetical protein
MKHTLRHSDLLSILHYDPATGAFTWTEIRRKGPNAPGAPAGSVFTHPKSGHKYLILSLLGHRYRAHNVAVFYTTGRWPEGEVDHKDGDGLNNRWRNLREATRSQNHANSKRARNNTSGFKGVRLSRSGRYRARIAVNKKRIALGSFDTPEEAHDAYCRAAKKFFGEFARAE